MFNYCNIHEPAPKPESLKEGSLGLDPHLPDPKHVRRAAVGLKPHAEHSFKAPWILKSASALAIDWHWEEPAICFGAGVLLAQELELAEHHCENRRAG